MSEKQQQHYPFAWTAMAGYAIAVVKEREARELSPNNVGFGTAEERAGLLQARRMVEMYARDYWMSGKAARDLGLDPPTTMTPAACKCPLCRERSSARITP